MNKHIELVKKWLADPLSVTQQELDSNNDAAMTAAYATAATTETEAAYWIEKYEELQCKNPRTTPITNSH